MKLFSPTTLKINTFINACIQLPIAFITIWVGEFQHLFALCITEGVQNKMALSIYNTAVVGLVIMLTLWIWPVLPGGSLSVANVLLFLLCQPLSCCSLLLLKHSVVNLIVKDHFWPLDLYIISTRGLFTVPRWVWMLKANQALRLLFKHVHNLLHISDKIIHPPSCSMWPHAVTWSFVNCSLCSGCGTVYSCGWQIQ